MSRKTQKEMFQLIETWQQSGLSQREWCLQHDISVSGLQYWIRRFKKSKQVPDVSDDPGFVQLVVPSRNSSSHLPWCELRMADGVTLCFHQPLSADFIRSLLR